jgi:hypothetical protein
MADVLRIREGVVVVTKKKNTGEILYLNLFP